MFVSYLLFAYNQERFVEAAVRSALEQTYDLMEVIVTDDGSSDATARIIEEVLAAYRGPKTVLFNRRPINGGLGAAINSAAALAKGNYVVVAAGDDISAPERTAVLMAAFRADPDLMCLHSNARYIDDIGSPGAMHSQAAPEQLVQSSFIRPMAGLLGASAAYHVDVFRRFGPLTDRLAAEDKVLPFRAAMIGTIGYVHRSLVYYRRHAGNVWLGATKRAQAYEDWHSQLAYRRLAIATVVRQRLADLATFTAGSAGVSMPLQLVREANARTLTRLMLEHELLTMPLRPRNLWRALTHVKSEPATLRQKWGWIKQFVLPRIYHRGASNADREEAINRA